MPGPLLSRPWTAGLAAAIALSTSAATAQTPEATAPSGPFVQSTPEAAAAKSADQRISDLSREVEELKDLVHQLQDQVAKVAPAAQPAATTQAAATQPPAAEGTETSGAAAPKVAADVLRGMTINAMLDTYYDYNFNSPVGRVNSLRAYDVSSNSFSLNQADLLVESAADPANCKRLGMRLDLQYGQATSTLQGNPANELRPDVYRNVFQAYGTYVFPLEKGLTVDFGKWASSLGLEGNYTKDQLNYSRSYWFNYLPFYHTGMRAKLAVTDQVALNAWITNGTQQSEPFNNYKDWLLGLVLTPSPAVSWTLNYYQGQEHPDVLYLQNPTAAQQQSLPNEQGTYIVPIANPPDGKLQITDSYLTWQVSKALTLAAEADYVQQRLYSYSSPQRVQGGAFYVGYQLSSAFAFSARVEYLADIGGLFSGTTQYLKEATMTLDYRPTDGMLIRGEFRRDQSNRRYFLGHTLDDPKESQPTLGIGLMWWLGQKEGAW